MQPRVTGVMLVNGRFGMVARAVQSFLAQDYSNKYLLLWDTGEPHYAPPFVYDPHGIEIWHRHAGPPIGALRNAANTEARGEIIVHFDSDDLSHPRRISEQVALLESSGKATVGFREMLFWHCAPAILDVSTSDDPKETMPKLRSFARGGEAWIYRNADPRYALGASLCYWRKTWEGRPFPDQMTGEDTEWLRGLEFDSLGVSALECGYCAGGKHNILPCCPECGIKYDPSRTAAAVVDQPRMIATIHGSNTNKAYATEMLCHDEWRRAPSWDDYCRKVLA